MSETIPAARPRAMRSIHRANRGRPGRCSRSGSPLRGHAPRRSQPRLLFAVPGARATLRRRYHERRPRRGRRATGADGRAGAAHARRTMCAPNRTRPPSGSECRPAFKGRREQMGRAESGEGLARQAKRGMRRSNRGRCAEFAYRCVGLHRIGGTEDQARWVSDMGYGSALSSGAVARRGALPPTHLSCPPPTPPPSCPSPQPQRSIAQWDSHPLPLPERAMHYP